jgi:hypothetical protein
MIGKKVPTEDGRFRIEVPTAELEQLPQMATTDFFAEWMKQVVPEKPRESSIKEMPLTVFELDDDYSPAKVFETTVKSASMTIDGHTYDIPLDTAIVALQNMDENSEITYKENK